MHAEPIRNVRPQDLSALVRVSMQLSGSLDLSVVLQTAIESAVEILGADTGALYLCDDAILHLGATTPRLTAAGFDVLATALPEEHPHIAETLRSMQPVFLGDASKADLSEAEALALSVRKLRSVLYVPVVAAGKAIGVMVLGVQKKPREFAGEEVALCQTLSSQIGLAVRNADLFESAQRSAQELSDAYEATLAGWSNALELRDEETAGHTERSAELAVELARELGVPDQDLAHMRRGALLHDIGKMAVPDAILRKPGPLTDDEWVVMRRHPVHARDFLSHIDYLTPAMDIPYCHHERWNGKGYPQGLKGEEIPLSARIFAVIDVYDALTSDRPYRAAWTHREALAHIELQAGMHFDPTVVEAFVRRMNPQAE